MKRTTLDFRWGPIPLRLIPTCQWTPVFIKKNSLLTEPWPRSYHIYHKGLGLFLCNKAELERVGWKTFQWWINKPFHRRRALKIWRSQITELLCFVTPFTREYIQKLTDKDLEAHWKELNERIEDFWRVAIIPEIAGYGALPQLQRALRQHGLQQSEIDRSASVLSSADRLSFYQIEERNLLRIYRIRSLQQRAKALEHHALKYAWIGNSYGAPGHVSLPDFQKRFRSARITWRNKLIFLSRLVKHHELQRSRALRIIQATPELRQIAAGIALCVGWQDQRKGILFQYLSTIDVFINEFAKRAQVPRRYFDMAHWEEVRIRLSASENERLKNRTEAPFIAQMDTNGLRVVTGRSAKDFFKENWEIPTSQQNKILHGIVAYKTGKRISGSAYIVRNHHDLQHFPAGRILVATMTAPEYIVALRKARAIVTDVGGLTSHAAIVSRELKLPCIVGTKHATQLIKNGDRLSINTKTGVVEKMMK